MTAVLVLVWALPAQAQFAQPGAQPPPCLNEFIALRDDAQKKGLAIKSAGERRAPQAEICKLLQNFAAAEAKMVKYADTNGTWCGIPPQAITQMKASLTQTRKIRSQACAAGTAAQVKPPAPSLSDALGTSRTPPPQSGGGRGTFDTLTGNALRR
ncbi:MAG: hypothetical protein HY056_06055 [Proteobacteria bacterium]|nr:hypothetical protein [Pseudomonadota bacterium]